MDDARFDQIARSLGGGFTRRGMLALVAGIAGAAANGASAKRRKRKHGKRGKQQQGNGGGQHNGGVCAAAGNHACDARQTGRGRNLSGCDLAGAALVSVQMNGANFSKASFAGAHMMAANLSGANLRDACLAEATLIDASMRGANLGGADLTGAALCGADLRGANVTRGQLATADVCCATRLSGGKSAAPCPTGRTCCGHGCADLLVDTANCGACGNVCAKGQVCCSGECVAQGSGSLCELGGPACLPDTEDLQAAIDGTPEYGTLQLCAGTWTLIDTVLIGQSITIIGAASGTTTITAPEQNAALGIQLIGIRSSARVSMQNLQLLAGFAEQGAGIFNQGDLTLADCDIVNNQAMLGGGIYNEGTLHIIRGNLTGNSTDNIFDQRDPGTIGAGALYNDEGTVLTEATDFSGNLGGHFSSNPDDDAAGYGGAIYNYFGTLTLKSGTAVKNNQANYEGGGIYNEGGAVYTYGSNLTGNAAGETSGQAGYGGGIFLLGGSLLIDAASRVTGNAAVASGDGGGVYLDDNSFNRHISSVSIAPKTVTGNAPNDIACNAYANSDGFCG